MLIQTLRIVYSRRSRTSREPPARIQTPADAAMLLASFLEQQPVEVFGVLCLTTQHDPLAFHEASRGSLDAAIVHPREVFKPAILANAGAIIVAHNHPSGDPHPSPPDVTLTRRLCACGDLLGIQLLDHVVIGSAGRFYSFALNHELSSTVEGGINDGENYRV